MLMGIIGWIVWGLVALFVALRFIFGRGEVEFADQVLSAVGYQFGRHAEKSLARRRGA